MYAFLFLSCKDTPVVGRPQAKAPPKPAPEPEPEPVDELNDGLDAAMEEYNRSQDAEYERCYSISAGAIQTVMPMIEREADRLKADGVDRTASTIFQESESQLGWLNRQRVVEVR